MKKFFTVGAVVVGVAIIIGAAFMIGNHFYNRRDPRLALTEALLKTWGEIKPSDIHAGRLFADIVNNAWQLDTTVSINKLGGSYLPLTPPVRSALEILTFKNTTRRQTEARQWMQTTSVQLAVTPLADISLYADPEQVSLQVPLAFDYMVTLNPRQVTREWDSSLLGAYVFPIQDIIVPDAFYEYYRMLLFSPVGALAEPSEFIRLAGILNEGAEYIYNGKTDYAGGKAESYTVNLTAAALNNYWLAAAPDIGLTFPDDAIGDAVNGWIQQARGLRFDGGLTAHITVYEGKVAACALTFTPVLAGRAWPCEAEVTLHGEVARLDQVSVDMRIGADGETYRLTGHFSGEVSNPTVMLSRIDFQLYEGGADEPLTAADWQFRWNHAVDKNDNFALNLTLQSAAGQLAFEVGGGLTADADNRRMEASFKKVALSLSNAADNLLEVSLNVKGLLTADDTPFAYPPAQTVPLTSLGELDALAMYARILADPGLGRLLGEMN